MIKMKNEIIIIMKFIPAPAYSGGAKRNLAWLKFLSKFYKVNLIGFFDKTYGNTMIKELNKYNINVYGYTFKRKLFKNFVKSILLNKSLINLQYYNTHIKRKINEILKQKDIQFIMCEELAMMNYCTNLFVPIYFDDHNIEYILMKRTAEYNKFPLNIFLNREAKLIKKEEVKSFKLAKKIFVVSENDKLNIDNIYREKVIVVNNTYEKKKIKKVHKKTKNIVFVGNVSWKPNLHGLKHFIEHIFPKVLEEDNKIILNIVGSNIPNEIKQMKDDNICIYENATEQLKDQIIDESIVCVVPVYFGGGTRIKILEYWAHSKPVVSTKIGAEGLIKSEGTYICDDDYEFAKTIINLVNNTNDINLLGKQNHEKFLKNYCEENVYGNSLYNTINTK